MKRYFITGTDTDCGKTYVTTQLLKAHSNSIAIKPIASGCSMIDGQLVNADAEQLTRDNHLNLEQINPWRFKEPISPHLAAKKEQKSIDVKTVAQYCMDFYYPGMETLFIEGAGGLMVPLNDYETWIDFLKYTRFPVLLVVGMRLGCINHALLTRAVLAAHQIPCVGWIANCLDPQMLALEENISSLTRFLDIPLWTTIPFL